MIFEVQWSQAMQSLWLYYLIWESLPILEAHPISPTLSSGTNESFAHWDLNWLKYAIGLLGITVTAFTLVGCLCCRRNRRPKGFQDCGGNINKEFKDGNSIENDPSLPQLQGLELQVPVSVSLNDRVQFEPLPVERFIPEVCVSPRPKPPPPSPSLFEDDSEMDRSTLRDSCTEWFQKTELHVPREKLKYLREIGHGWFGKVVEGCAELQGINLNKSNIKNGNIVVRILTEEATAKEKAWFLGEATPYFKLRHRNVLSLFGSCLETDPYLLLFESCPLGDLKGFLRSNQDPQSQRALIKENMPTRIAIEIGAGLRHMHEHGLAHTDLSARNCLVASDLSIKLGDYGTAVEKYPEDYYVLGDRALPIRWSAPESVECTETTIETREITPRANLWSYAVLLWEIAMWGKRPYNDLGDEKVIEMLLSSKTGLKPVGSQLLLQNREDCASNLLEAIKVCLILEPDKRLPIEQVRHILLKDQLEDETSDFEQRWETLRPNVSKDQTRSASLQDLRGSLDSEQWPSLTQTSFRLGPEEPVKNAPGGLIRSKYPFRDSDSETEEESWRGRVERGAYTEKVKQKSKSVADLMVLVHIEPDSDADLSLGPQMPVSEKSTKKRLPATGSDGDLPSAIFDDQFDLVLRKLRDTPISGNSLLGPKVTVSSSNFTERPKLLTLTMDQGQTPILRLAIDPKEEVVKNEEIIIKCSAEYLDGEPEKDIQQNKDHVIRLLSKGDSNQSLLQYDDNVTAKTVTKNSEEVKESQTSMGENEENSTLPCFSNNFQVTNFYEDDCATVKAVDDNNHGAEIDLEDMNSWNNALDTVLEQKTVEYNAFATPSPVHKIEVTNEVGITPSPQSRAEYSAEDAEDEFSNAEDLPGLSKRHLPMDDEDERKRMSTPDDERSSDSGFRDKESCEEEESPLPGPLPTLIASQSNTPRSTTTHDSAEEEQLRILFELDTILDAECYDALNNSTDSNNKKIVVQESNNPISNVIQKDVDLETETSEMIQSTSDVTGETEKEVIPIEKSSSDDANLSYNTLLDSQPVDSESVHLDLEPMPIDSSPHSTFANDDIKVNTTQTLLTESNSWPCLATADNNEDEDSSTMSLRSDNSYVSFGMDEEFVAAIRNELREKLPHAQMSVIETQEPHDEDEPSLISDVDSKNWDDEVEDELADRSGVIDIAIRYNTYGTPLSPILEERESAGNSESANVTRDDSRDASIASKLGSNSLSEDDVLLIDTQSNRATLVEGIPMYSQESQEFLNHEMSDDENHLSILHQQSNRPLYPIEKRFGGILTGGTGAPLPSPEEEACKWQQQISAFPMLPPQLQDNLMSTSFASEQDWDSDEEDDEEGPSESIVNELDEEDEDEDDDEGEDGIMDEDDDDEDDDEENSSSSGEFVWQQYGASHVESHETEDLKKDDIVEAEDPENDLGDDFETEDEEEEEFTPSAWDATLAPHRSALRSPDKTVKSGDQKKSVWFKKQRYHCVYEYPKETPPIENQSPTVSAWEPTSYTDWEEMIDNIDRLNFQPMDYFETNSTRGEEEFYVSSSNRPFQFQSGNGKYVSQFFPGAGGSSTASTSQDVLNQESPNQQIEETPTSAQQQSFSDRQQLGELRHTRDRLKLNLVTSSSNGGNGGKVAQLCNPVKQGIDMNDENNDNEDVDKVRVNENMVDEENNTNIDKKTEVTQPELQKNVKEEVTCTMQQPILASVNMSPSDGQFSESIEKKNNRDFDVD